MGKQNEENAVFCVDVERSRMLSLVLTGIADDEELPTVREVLAAIGIQTSPIIAERHSLQHIPARFFAWDGGRTPIENFERKVVRGERLLWSSRSEI